MSERLLKVQDVAERLGLSQRAIWNYRDMGFMPAAIKLRGAVRWREMDINEWIVNGCPDCRANERRGRGKGRA